MPELSALNLSNLDTLPKLGVKGQGAETWLREQRIDVPATTYETARLADGGLIARLGSADLFLESGGPGELLAHLQAEIGRNPPLVYRVERQDATLVLAGEQSVNVLAQLCSFDFRSAPAGRLVLTRASGVNCMILPSKTG